MKIFGADKNTRGCFIRFDVNAQKSQGAMIKLPSGDSLPDPKNSLKLPVVVTAINGVLKENVAHLKCFNTRVYTYTFGADIGIWNVDFSAFLINGSEYSGDGKGTGGGSSDVMANFLQKYADARISASKKEAVLHLGTSGEVIRGQVTKLSTATQNVETDVQNFRLELTVIPRPPKDK